MMTDRTYTFDEVAKVVPLEEDGGSPLRHCFGQSYSRQWIAVSKIRSGYSDAEPCVGDVFEDKYCQDYIADMREGRPVPPLVVMPHDDHFHVMDGTHRAVIAIELGISVIEAFVGAARNDCFHR